MSNNLRRKRHPVHFLSTLWSLFYHCDSPFAILTLRKPEGYSVFAFKADFHQQTVYNVSLDQNNEN